MNKDLNKTPSGEAVQVDGEFTGGSFIRLALMYLAGEITLQRMLYILAFVTFGIGDGFTAAYMMERTGAMREANPIVRLAYIYGGWNGAIFIKMWFTFLILSIVGFIYRKGNMYWMVNGFLFALIIGGIMAMRANIMAGMGSIPPSPLSIVVTFLFLTILFVNIGDEIDKLLESRRTKGAYESVARGSV